MDDISHMSWSRCPPSSCLNPESVRLVVYLSSYAVAELQQIIPVRKKGLERCAYQFQACFWCDKDDEWDKWCFYQMTWNVWLIETLTENHCTSSTKVKTNLNNSFFSHCRRLRHLTSNQKAVCLFILYDEKNWIIGPATSQISRPAQNCLWLYDFDAFYLKIYKKIYLQCNWGRLKVKIIFSVVFD